MTKKVRLAVLGAGSWTCVNHLPALEGRDDVEFVAALDSSEDRRRNVESRFPFSVVTDDLEEALATEPSAVIVGATPDAHHELVSAALSVGANVLCEKPFTTSGLLAWDLVERARREGVHLLTAYGWNYMPIVRDAKTLLEQHGIGTIEHIQIHMATALREMYQRKMPVWGRPDEFRPIPTSYTELGKGAGYNQAQISHALGIALWLSGLRGQSVFALMTNPDADVDLHDAISMRMTNGASASVSGACSPLGANNSKHQMEVRLFGSDGQLIIDLEREFVWLYKDAAHDFKLPVQVGDGAYACDGPPNTLVDLTLGNAVENCSPGELAARATEITETAYRSWRSSRLEPVISPSEDSSNA